MEAKKSGWKGIREGERETRGKGGRESNDENEDERNSQSLENIRERNN